MKKRHAGQGQRLALRAPLTSRDLALVACFAALIAVLGLMPTLNLGPVPITIQTLGVTLTGVLLGWRRGLMAVAVFLTLLAAGLPILSGGHGGMAAFARPGVGFTLSWLVCVVVIGLLVDRRLPRLDVWWLLLVVTLGGMGVMYLIGVPVMAWRLHLPWDKALAIGLGFVPGDLIKTVLTVVVARSVVRAYPPILEGRQASDRIAA